MTRSLAFIACALALSAGLARADSWTNKAGHVLSAKPVSLKGSLVVFEEGERIVTCPLAVFLPAEQRRLKDALGIVEIPDGLKDAHALRQRTLTRLRLLHDEQKLSDEEYTAQGAKTHKVYQEQADRHQRESQSRGR
jgi:hypothetical protein